MLLSTQGLVEANAQRGFRVFSATEDDLKEITLCLEVERLGLTWSLQNGDIAWEGQIIASHHALSRVQSEVIATIESALAWDEANRLFRISLTAACDSPRLIASQVQLYDESRRFILAVLRKQQLDFTSISEN